MSNLKLNNAVLTAAMTLTLDKTRRVGYETMATPHHNAFSGDTVTITHHGNAIAEVGRNADGELYLYLTNSGWNSTTTANRLRKFAWRWDEVHKLDTVPPLAHIKDGVMCVNSEPLSSMGGGFYITETDGTLHKGMPTL